MEKFTISRMEMGSAFRKRRKMLGITSTSLSEKTGVLETRLCQHETGGSPIKQFELVQKIAKVLCDDGTLLAKWVFAANGISYETSELLNASLESMKLAMNLSLYEKDNINE